MTSRIRKLAAACAATLALVATLVTPALAGAPKLGKYECWGLSMWVNLKTDSHYTVQTGGGGKWHYAASAKRIVFKTGPMDFAYGIYGKDSTGTPLFALHDAGDDSSYGACTK